jgi:hypothetical protein
MIFDRALPHSFIKVPLGKLCEAEVKVRIFSFRGLR